MQTLFTTSQTHNVRHKMTPLTAVFSSLQTSVFNKVDISRQKNCTESSFFVPAGSPSCGWDGTVYVFDINQPSLPTPFYSVLVSIYVFKAFSTVFHPIDLPDNSPLSRSALPVLFLPYWSFN